MKQEINKSFLKAARDIFTEIGIPDCKILQFNSHNTVHRAIANIGITGDLYGYMMIKFLDDAAMNVVNMMAKALGVIIEEEGFGQLRRESVGEIINQLAARATMNLADNNIDCDITPPTILVGDKISSDLMMDTEYNLTFTINGSFGKIDLFVGLKKK